MRDPENITLQKCLDHILHHPSKNVWNTLLCPFTVQFLERRMGGKGGREGVRGRARRYRTGVEEGGSEGQGQQEQDGVEKGG